MSGPTRDFLQFVADGQVEHDGNPVLSWCVDNLVLESDAAGNLKPTKRQARGRIDGAVAAIMALGRAVQIQSEGVPTLSWLKLGS